MHESGRRHKGNVERTLRETRKRAAIKEKEDSKLAKTLEQIEKAALISHQRDTEHNGGVPAAKRHAIMNVIPLTPDMIKYEQDQIKLQMIDKLTKRQLELEQESTSLNTITDTKNVPSSDSSPWQQLVSPDGYTYYYNSVTGVSQWECPTDNPHMMLSTEHISTSDYNSQTVTMTTKDQSSDKTKSEVKTKTDSNKDIPDNDLIPDMTTANPYGSWTTVSIRPREELKENDKEEEEEEVVESSEDDNSSDEDTKFKEKATPTSTTNNKDQIVFGNFKGFTFKKRTATNKTNLKKRTSDW